MILHELSNFDLFASICGLGNSVDFVWSVELMPESDDIIPVEPIVPSLCELFELVCDGVCSGCWRIGSCVHHLYVTFMELSVLPSRSTLAAIGDSSSLVDCDWWSFDFRMVNWARTIHSAMIFGGLDMIFGWRGFTPFLRSVCLRFLFSIFNLIRFALPSNTSISQVPFGYNTIHSYMPDTLHLTINSWENSVSLWYALCTQCCCSFLYGETTRSHHLTYIYLNAIASWIVKSISLRNICRDWWTKLSLFCWSVFVYRL